MSRARLVPLALVALLLLTGCGSGDSDTPQTITGQCSYPKTDDAAKKAHRPPETPPKTNPDSLTITTSAGAIPVTLEPTQAPCAVNSFVSLADQGYYDDTTCHRLTTQGYFVLQCGDPSGTGRGGPGYSFADELVDDDPRLQPCGTENGQDYCTYNAGTVAMANAGPNTNGSQFFLVYGNSKFPPDYTIIGHLDAAGLAVVKAIAAKGIGTPNGIGPGDGAPKEPVTITGVR